MRSAKYIWRLLYDTWNGFSHDNGLRLAASLAYYAILSLGPMMVLLLAIIGSVWDVKSAQTELSEEVEHFIGGPAAQAMIGVINQANLPTLSGRTALLSAVVLLFSGTAVFAQLQESMNTIFNVPKRQRLPFLSVVRQRLISLGMLMGLALLTLLLVITSSVVEFIMQTVAQVHPIFKLLQFAVDWTIALMVFVGLFAAIFKLLPEVAPPWRDIRIGALVTGLMFAIGRELISETLSRSKPSSAYGAAGSIIVILLWVYYSSAILFFGAEFTQALARARERAAQEELASAGVDSDGGGVPAAADVIASPRAGGNGSVVAAPANSGAAAGASGAGARSV